MIRCINAACILDCTSPGSSGCSDCQVAAQQPAGACGAQYNLCESN